MEHYHLTTECDMLFNSLNGCGCFDNLEECGTLCVVIKQVFEIRPQSAIFTRGKCSNSGIYQSSTGNL